jgi:hypothetical protein
MTHFRDRYLLGTSSRSRSIAARSLGYFDLVLVAPSWDRRCVCIAETALTADKVMMLRFNLKDPGGLQIEHEQKLERFAGRVASEFLDIKGDATALRNMWDRIWSAMTELRRGKRAPLRVLVDLSTCPRFYSLGMIVGVLRAGIAQTVTVLYAEGKYGKTPIPLTVDYPFTVGHWQAHPVPFLFGNAAPTRKKHFIVSVGFEGRRTARVLSKEDPDRVSVLFPRPGVRRGYVEQAWERNKETIEEYRIPKSNIINAPAGDAIAVWKNLANASLERPGLEEVSYLCCGTKPHSLGMALRAACLDFPTVLYNRPEAHSFVDVWPTGVYWQYEIRDLSSFPMIP